MRRRARALIPKRWHERLERLERGARVYIIPTMMGWYFAAISLVLFLIAIFYGHNLAYFATFLFFSFVSLSAIVANNNVSAISLRWKQNQARARAKGKLILPLLIENTSGRTRYDLRVEIAGHEIACIDQVPGHSTREFELDLSKLELERGVYRVAHFVVATRFPFSLFYAWSWQRCELELLIHPAPAKENLGQTFSTREREGSGGISQRMGNDEFFMIRPHRRGEGLTRLDRRFSLRVGAPQIREFRDEKARSLVLDLRYGQLENVLAQAVTWLDRLPSELECGFILPNGQESEFYHGSRQRAKLYDVLARYDRPPQELA